VQWGLAGGQGPYAGRGPGSPIRHPLLSAQLCDSPVSGQRRRPGNRPGATRTRQHQDHHDLREGHQGGQGPGCAHPGQRLPRLTSFPALTSRYLQVPPVGSPQQFRSSDSSSIAGQPLLTRGDSIATGRLRLRGRSRHSEWYASSKEVKGPALSSMDEGFHQDLSLSFRSTKDHFDGIISTSCNSQSAPGQIAVTISRKDQRMKVKPTLTIEIVSDIV